MKKFYQLPCPVICGFRVTGQAVLIPCRRWSCPKCARRLARRWGKRTFMHLEARKAENGHTWYFLTVTLGSGFKDPALAYPALKKLWNRLRMRLTRKMGKYEYIAFVEGQPKRLNMPHFHIILSKDIPGLRGKQGRITSHRV